MTLGQIIRAYREENSMSMDRFAKASGLSKGYISPVSYTHLTLPTNSLV